MAVARAKVTADYRQYLLERLRDPAEAVEYLNAALEEDDGPVFLLALRDVAEAHGIGKVAAEAHLNRENVYRILSQRGNPRWSSIGALLHALGLQLTIKPAEG
jgi:probable addiction module antidote protein